MAEEPTIEELPIAELPTAELLAFEPAIEPPGIELMLLLKVEPAFEPPALKTLPAAEELTELAFEAPAFEEQQEPPAFEDTGACEP